MEPRIIHLPALILSAAVHSGLWLASGTAGMANGADPRPATPGTMTVELRVDEAAASPSVRQSLDQIPAVRYNDAAGDMPVSVTVPALLPVVTTPEPYYFRSSQLTQKPLVLQDASADLILVLPELPDQVAILRLFISDHGIIDRVLVENSHLPESAERKLVAAFSKMTFQPGKIGRIAVRSQLRIEVKTTDFSFSDRIPARNAG
ncbi:MAG TPA: hypothetical protein VGE12_19470 [Noviherbaspirillum sp.]